VQGDKGAPGNWLPVPSNDSTELRVLLSAEIRLKRRLAAPFQSPHGGDSLLSFKDGNGLSRNRDKTSGLVLRFRFGSLANCSSATMARAMLKNLLAANPDANVYGLPNDDRRTMKNLSIRLGADTVLLIPLNRYPQAHRGHHHHDRSTGVESRLYRHGFRSRALIDTSGGEWKFTKT
jgi:hypothetical protein